MKPLVPKRQNCAIYTRKSTEHNLDLAFNSLDAQREACEAYIKSQAHEGWTLIRDKFDDGGLSGASLERPALQALLDEVRSKKIDILVVYKVDRLTRSLADFAKLVELFDALGVFGSADPCRPAIAASARSSRSTPRRPRWCAKSSRTICASARSARWPLRLMSKVRPRPRIHADGTAIAAERFMVGPLAHLLKNRFYVGDVVYKGEVHKGEHEPILEREIFEAVQARLAPGKVRRKLARSKSPAILMGLIFDDRGNPMSPSHANKNGVRYRHYVSHALLQDRKAASGSIARVSAPDVEALVCDAIDRTNHRICRSRIATSSTGSSNASRSARTSSRSRSATMKDRLELAPRLPYRSPLSQTLPAGKASPMRPPIWEDEFGNAIPALARDRATAAEGLAAPAFLSAPSSLQRLFAPSPTAPRRRV